MHKEACKCQWFAHYHKGTIFFPYFSVMHFYICTVSPRNFNLTVMYLIFLFQILILDRLKSNKKLSLAPDGLQHSLKWKTMSPNRKVSSKFQTLILLISNIEVIWWLFLMIPNLWCWKKLSCSPQSDRLAFQKSPQIEDYGDM